LRRAAASCGASGGQLIEILGAFDMVMESSCTFDDGGVNTCNWWTDTCSSEWPRSTGPRGDIGPGGVIVFDPVFDVEPADPASVKVGGIAIPTGGTMANVVDSGDLSTPILTVGTMETSPDAAPVAKAAQPAAVSLSGEPVVDDIAPEEIVTVANVEAPVLDKDAFKTGCQEGGGSHVENPDGSFQCNLRDGGVITCPNTPSPCTSTPPSRIGPSIHPRDLPLDVVEATDDGVVAPRDPVPPVAEPMAEPVVAAEVVEEAVETEGAAPDENQIDPSVNEQP